MCGVTQWSTQLIYFAKPLYYLHYIHTRNQSYNYEKVLIAKKNADEHEKILLKVLQNNCKVNNIILVVYITVSIMYIF